MFSVTSNTKTSAFYSVLAVPAHSSASPPSSSPLQTVAQDLAKKATTVPVSGFSFPYAAYHIQNDLMRAIYTCIKTRRVGVFESPTGTGKTLSVICSTLTFLREHYQLGEDEDDENDQHDGLTTTTTTTMMGSNAVSAAVAVGVINPHHNKNSRPSTPIDDEPDWCVNFEAERSLSLKQKAFSKAKLFRDALAEKLEKLRLTTDSRSNERGGGGGGPSQGAARISKSERRHRYLRMRQETSGIANKLSTRPSILSSSKRERDSDDADLDQESTRSESESGGKVASSRQRRESSTLSGGGGGVESDDEDLRLIPLEYHSDEDEDAKAVSEASSVSATLGIADRIREQVARERASFSATQRGSEKEEEEEEEEAAAFRPKIFFVSRTHSQISQFVREIGKTEFGKNVRVVALGSRSTLCVNPEVVDLPTDARVNERCIELQDEARGSSAAAVAAAAAAAAAAGGKVGKQKQQQQQQHRDHDKKSGEVVPAGKKGCPFIDAASQEVFKDRLLAGLRDVEDAAELGWTSGTCAYYGSRKAIKYAEVVAMPYSMLLHSGTRAAAGIEPHLKGSVVVIDEAHNIIDAINSTHAAIVTYHQLIVAAEAVTEYLTKYKSRMKGSNVAHCSMLAEAFFSLAHFLKPTSTRSETSASPAPNPISLSTLSSTAPKGSSPNTDSFQIPLYSTSSFRPPHPASSSSSSASSSSFHDISAGNSPPMVPSMSGGQSSQQSSHSPSRSDSPLAVSVSVSTIAAQIAAISSDSPVATSNTAPTTPTVTPAQSASRERTISPLLHGTPINQQRAAFVTSSSSSSSSLPGSKTATCVRDAPTVAMFSPVIAPPLHPSSMTASSSSSSSSHLHRPTPLSGNLLFQTLGSGHMSPQNVDLPTPQPLSLPNSSVHTVSDFLVCSGITMSSSKSSSSSSSSSSTSSTSTNLFKVRRYVEAVDLLKKLRGFAESGARAAAAAAAKEVVIHTRKHQKGGGGTSTSHTLQRSSHTSSSAITAAATGGEITMNNGGGGESGKMINSTATSASSSYMASVTAIQTAYNFLCCLMGADCDGRIVVNRVGIDFNSSRGASTDVASSSISSSSQPFFKFVLLNPAVPFLRVVQNARSVVLVGGTMQPISDITDQLFGHLPSNRVITFSCGHVIPRENLAVFTLAKGPTGQAFDFRHASRSSTAMIAELGRAIVNLSSLIPSGLVVFMPSYDYLRTALAIWSKAPTQQQQQHSTSQVGGGSAQPLLTYQQQMDVQNFKSSSSSIAQTAAQQQQQQQSLPGASLPAAPVGSVLAMLQKKKRVFAEPKSSSDVEAILRAYTLAIRSPSSSSSSSRPPSRSDTPIRDDGGFYLLDEESDVNHNDHVDDDNARLFMNSSTIPTGGSIGGGGGGGALLFCVVGGKMSEGINFSDDLARGVAVVGLPYPNPSDPELVERMAYLDRRGAANVNQQQQQQQQQHSTLFLSSSGTLNNTSSNTSTLPLPSPPPAPHSMTTGREYYENLTIRAVNQAIGRSIRHAKDYAVIVLLDGRYTQQRIKSKLPGWISERISSSSSVGGVDPNGWGPCASGIGNFFRTKAAGAATSGSSVTSTVLKAV